VKERKVFNLSKRNKNTAAANIRISDKKSIKYALPIIFMLTLFMFAIRGCAVRTYLENVFWYSGKGIEGDIYSYFRMQIFIFVSFVSFIWILLSKACGSKDCRIYNHNIYIPMIVYSILVLLSFAVSSYKNIAMAGYSERHEGTFVLIGYMVILFVSMNTMYTERAFKVAMYAFVIACIPLGIWGILQVHGIDIMSLPKWLFIPKKLRSGNLTMNNGANIVKWFFSNQNYASFFMVFPITISAFLSVVSKNMKMKVLFAAVSGLMMYNLWNASSLGGMVACCVTFIAGIILFNKYLLKWKASVIMILIALVSTAGISMGKILPQIESGAQAAAGTIIKTVYAAEDKNFIKIDYIETNGPDIIYSFAGNEITIKTANDNISGVYDSEGNNIGLDNKFFTASVKKGDSKYTELFVKTAKRTWAYGIVNGEIYYASPSGQGIKLGKTESFGFKNHESFATNRGYIWSRTLPLLKKTFIVGHGADTFALYFPQSDYAGKYNVGFFDDGCDTIVDKPHNMYLGTAVNTGVLSLIALMCIYIMYVIESIETYRKCRFDTFSKIMGGAIFIAVIGFLVGGLVNDSTVQITPIFYTFLGIGFAVNRIVKGMEFKNDVK
jgi:hypothetical protein